MSLNKSKVLRAAEKYVLQGKIPAAIDEYRKVVDADPSDLTTINTLGDLYVRAGKIQDAIRNFSRIAESYRESGFTLKAIAMLKKISKLDPTNVDTSMKLANLYSQQGLLVEARQQYLQVADAFARAGQTRKALEAYQKIADLDPTNTSVRLKLGEIYSREGMTELAHEAFIMTGAEFLRKGDIEQALNANLKAITINPESRQGLTAIATIYTQQGQADRAINILYDAFEKNPGDIELLTILGRTYLSAGLMDESERTFLSLVELDKNRYHYLLEVGRRFLQIGDLDRAAEQIDGCLDVLISKREEDKAIDFLRRVLDRDMNHIGSLKRLAQIFMRIREDHNLISTLNSLAEAAMRKGQDEEAITALKELVRLEPDESMHLQRLYNLGVRDIQEGDSPEVVRATGPLDYESAAFDDAFVIRQISEAEIMAGHGQIDHAVSMLNEMLNHTPDNLQIHLKLKDIYLRAGMMDKAAIECLELARVHEGRGESARASDYVAEARQMNPLLEIPAPSRESRKDVDWFTGTQNAAGSEEARSGSTNDPMLNGPGGFEVQEDANGLDLSRYQTGTLTDQAGFVTVPEGARPGGRPASGPVNGNKPSASPAQGFRYSDTLVGDPLQSDSEGTPAASLVFNSTSELPSDTMSSLLRDELEGIDFYIAQGYVEIARDTLTRLREEHGDHPEIMGRYKRLGINTDVAEADSAQKGFATTVEPPAVFPDWGQPSSEAIQERAGSDFDLSPAADRSERSFGNLFLNDMPEESAAPNGEGDQAQHIDMKVEEDASAAQPDVPKDFSVSLTRGPREGERKNFLPFLVQKESGPLDADLMVQWNTSELPPMSELLNGTAFDALRPATGPLVIQPQEPMGTGDLIESIVSSIDSTMEDLAPPRTRQAEASPQETPVFEDRSVNSEPASQAKPDGLAVTESELQEMLEELKENTGDLKPGIDFETHYSLGLAYKDMDLLDDAIEQFQMAFKTAALEDLEGNYIQCCHMLGVCFNRKGMPKVAVMWFERGLRIPNRPEEEYQALRYEIGLCYEELNEIDKAIDAFMQVYGTDVNYRHVGDKIKQLQAMRGA
ncbi:MAG TPA: tetratricopeptide repeat protein [Blastocatellia bacterium]|jgi:tetratricopeptide (TPR) repeat protein|nr:tetratricopeptide repeat protein [Blastocatellia bacterium]